MSRAVTIGPDATNSYNRRVFVDGAQWCKVYGWDSESARARAETIAAALAAPTPRASASVTPGPGAEEVAATCRQEPREALNSPSPLAGDQGALVDGWLPIDLDNPPAEPILAASINHGNQEVVVWRRRSGRKEYGWGNTGPNCDRFFANARYFTHYRPLAPVTQASTGGAA